MSVNYSAAPAAGAAANTTAANAGVIGVYNPTAAPGGGARIYEWEIGPANNSADNTYTVRLRRNTTVSTWGSAVTPTDCGPRLSTALTLVGVVSTARGTLTAGNVGLFGFHMRGGYRWVAIPGGELQLSYSVNNGVEIEWTVAQGTDTMAPSVYFAE